MIRVLLVDDQDLVRAGLRGILRERFGFEIVGECGDGSTALAAVRGSHPDIVLVEVRMPVLDLHQVCRVGRATSRSKRGLVLPGFATPTRPEHEVCLW